MDAMFSTAALASAEKIINAALQYDPATRIALQHLAPQVLVIKLTAPEVIVYIVPSAEGVRLLSHYEGVVTTQLQGTISALRALLKSERVNLKDSGVQVVGSTVFLAELQHILKNMDIDWEEMLSQLLGDIVGHQGANAIRTNIHWAKDRIASMTRLTREFLTEESHTLPSKPEVDFFNQQVDDVSLGVDRVEARINQLMQQYSRPLS
jgi:ubiquinone biosynthesis accessory factor UbiJ